MSLKNTGSGSQWSIHTSYNEDLEDVTVSIWRYNGASTSSYIYSKWNGATTDGFGSYRSGSGTDWRVNCSHLSGTPNSCTQSQTTSASTWHHQVLRRTSGDVDHVLNNSYATNTAGTAGNMGTYDLYIGNSSAGLNGHIGNLVSFAVWNVALTNDEITSLYKGFSPRKIRPQSLRIYYPLIREAILPWGSYQTLDPPTVTADETLMPALRGF